MATLKVQCPWCTRMGEHDVALEGQKAPCPFCHRPLKVVAFAPKPVQAQCAVCGTLQAEGHGGAWFKAEMRAGQAQEERNPRLEFLGCLTHAFGGPGILLGGILPRGGMERWTVEAWVCEPHSRRPTWLSVWMKTRTLLSLAGIAAGLGVFAYGLTRDDEDLAAQMIVIGLFSAVGFPVVWSLLTAIPHAILTRRFTRRLGGGALVKLRPLR